jgi:Uma2 family endonuclease
MSDAAPRLMSNEEFLLWDEQQEDKHELVDGLPVKKYGDEPELIANGRRNHARITMNLAFALRTRLSGGPCEVLTDAFSVRTSIRKQRRPDVLVDCDLGSGEDMEARRPVVLFEVLSPTSTREDLVIKPSEYKRIDSVRCYVVAYQDAPLLKVWVRAEDGGWSDDYLQGLDAVLPLEALGAELPLAEIYEGVELTAA